VAALVSLGLRVRSGRAIAVVLAGSAESPVAIRRVDLIFSNARRPVTWQPYHTYIDLPWPKARAAVAKVAAAIRETAARSVGTLVAGLRDEGLEVRAAGIAASGAGEPAQIANPHIRAHAAEGVLFREAAEFGVDASGTPWRSYSERTIYEVAAGRMGLSAVALKSRVATLATREIRPWTAHEKMAALAAWCAWSELSR
jgi:hypothetical protein